MDHIKEELSGYAMELAPSDLPPNSQVKGQTQTFGFILI